MTRVRKIYFSMNFQRTRRKWCTNCAPTVMWKLFLRSENLPTNMEENKNSDEHGTHWAVNILCFCWKNQQEMVRNKLFANPVLITQISYSQTGSRTKCSQVYTQLYISITWYKHVENLIFCPMGVIFSTIISVLNVHRTILPNMALKYPLINL